MTTQAIGFKAKAFEPRNLAFIMLIAYGWPWFLWWLLFLSGIVTMPAGIVTPETNLRSTTLPLIILSLLSPYGPTLAGFVMTVITERRTGLKALWKRFWNRRLSIKWLVVILLFFPVLRLIANLVSRTLDGQVYPVLTWPNQPWMFIPPFIVNGLIHGGLSEEFGWRGYVLPRFQAKWNALVSSLVLGVIWGGMALTLAPGGYAECSFSSRIGAMADFGCNLLYMGVQ